MKNFIEKGETMNIVAGVGGIASGAPVVVVDVVGVSVGAYAEGETAVLHLNGVFELPKVASGAIPQGTKVYITSGGNITATATSNTFTGYAHETAADGATIINVLLAR